MHAEWEGPTLASDSADVRPTTLSTGDWNVNQEEDGLANTRGCHFSMKLACATDEDEHCCSRGTKRGVNVYMRPTGNHDSVLGDDAAGESCALACHQKWLANTSRLFLHLQKTVNEALKARAIRNQANRDISQKLAVMYPLRDDVPNALLSKGGDEDERGKERTSDPKSFGTSIHMSSTSATSSAATSLHVSECSSPTDTDSPGSCHDRPQKTSQ